MLRETYLLNLNFSVQKLLSSQFHGELCPGQDHRVSVQRLRRAFLHRLSITFPGADIQTPAGADGDGAAEEEAPSPV